MNRLSHETSAEMYAIHHTIICRFAKPNLTGDRRPISIFYLRQKVERLRHQVSGSFVSCVPSSTSSFVSSVSSGASSSESLCCLACGLKVFQPSWSYEQTCPQERLLNPPLKCCFPSAVWEIPLAPVTLPPQLEAWNLFHLRHLPWLQALLPPCTNHVQRVWRGGGVIPLFMILGKKWEVRHIHQPPRATSAECLCRPSGMGSPS